jgi:predicted deacylase
MAALKAFGAPLGMVWAHTLDHGFAQTAAMRRGLVCLSGEYGGGGSVSVDGVRIVERGIRNVLVHVGCLDPKAGAGEPATPTRLVEVRNRDYFVLAPEAGLFEPVVKLGDVVEVGQPCGQVHFVDNPGREPVPAHFRAAGMVISQRHFGRVDRGDCVAHVATDWKG